MLRKVFLLATVSIVSTSGVALAQTAPAANVVTNILDGAEPGKISVAGITVYGTVDVGYVYQSHGAISVPGSLYQGAPYEIRKFSGNSYSNYQNNALSQSMLGVKGEQSLQALSGMDSLRGWSLGFDLQVNFDPLSGQIGDICKTLLLNAGRTAFTQTANGDGSRCGQAFSGDALAYVKNDALGKLSFGRQSTLLSDVIGASDANKGAYAFSLLAFSGGFGGGGGLTEEGRWNNSFKYTNTLGPVRFGAAYRFEGAGQGGDGWGFMAGIDVPGALKGLTIEGAYSKENTGISSDVDANVGFLAGTVSDQDAWAITAKYKFADDSLLKGATIMGGYERIEFNNGSGRLDSLNTIGGYTLDPTTINYFKYKTERDQDVYWIGGKYAVTPKLTAAAGWYHVEQGSYVAGNANGTTNNTGTGAVCIVKFVGGLAAQKSNCAGTENFYSVSLDYQLTKRLDLYGGFSWSDVDGGLASGFQHTNLYSFASGVRFRF